MFKNFILPALMPNKKILSVDIGGSLAKTAFFIPKDDTVRHNKKQWETITSKAIPSKLTF
jgi:hypothetical protein